MTKNTLEDLNNHLFAQLERLGDESLEGEALDTEIKRAKAVNETGKAIIDNAHVVLQALKFNDEKIDANVKVPKMLGTSSGGVGGA